MASPSSAALADVVALPRPKAAKFQTDIEGLRAIAVLGVIAFHASVPGVTGGYAGVDVFFVISGYLITGLLVREALRTGKISFANFYARRARRILPAASLVLIATAAASFLVLSPLGAFRALRDVLASSVYVANWHFIQEGTNYLAASTDHSPVLHYWSLAVEEQFYIVWPALVLGAVVLSGSFPFARRRTVFLVLGAVTAISFMASLILTESDPTLAYMATTTRAWEFGVGAIVAIASSWLTRQQEAGGTFSRFSWVIGWAGVVAVVGSMLMLDSNTPFPGTAALWPTLGTAAIIVGGLAWGTSKASVGAFLSLAPVRFIGRMSFSWYLWHWPILILVEAKTGELDWTMRCALAGIALVLAIATYYLVEKPFMSSYLLRKRISSAIALGLLCMVLSTSTSLALGTAAATAASAQSAATALGAAGGFGTDNGAVAGPTTPSALDAGKDLPEHGECQLDTQVVTPSSCVVGDPSGIPVVVMGDSHANQWVTALSQMAVSHGWQLHILTKSGCPVPDVKPRDDGQRYSRADCPEWRQRTLDSIVNDIKPKIIFVSSLSTYQGTSEEILAAWDRSLDQLRETGSPIVYIRDTPFPSEDIPLCISGAALWSDCEFNFTYAKRIEPVPTEALRGNEPQVTVVDFTSLLCDADVCPAVRNGVLLYRDDSHLSATAVSRLAPAFDRLLEQAGLFVTTEKK